MSDTIVRPAEPHDLETLVGFVQNVALESEDAHLDPNVVKQGLEKALAHPDTVAAYTVAERDGALVGCLMVTREWSDWTNAWYWWIQSVYVTPEARGTGVFDAMYADVAGRAKAAGVSHLRLYVHEKNEAGLKAYARVGMSETPYRIYDADLTEG